MELNNLKPAKGSTHHDKRIGRGAGSGHGGTATRGRATVTRTCTATDSLVVVR